MTTYSIDIQLPEGEEEEKRLDDFFSDLYIITPVSREQQRCGIDRVWKGRKTGIEFTVEYKADSTAAQTGNIFVETVSVDVDDKKGWAYTSHSQLLVYYIPPTATAYTVPMTAIKQQLPAWSEAYPSRKVPNLGRNGGEYFTVGLLVPIEDFKKECEPRIWLVKEKTDDN